MNLFSRVWNSTLGKKYIMALTGAALFLFVVGHLVGNLQVFGPPEMINAYAHFLKSTPELLWGARIGLLIMVALHIAAAVTLSAENTAARPEPYAGRTSYGSSVQSRYMLVSGLVIAAFIIYHLAHFTALLPGINGVGDFRKLTTVLRGETVPDVYATMVLGFQVWWVVLLYLVAQALLFMHLSHGVASMFQSLGFRNHVWWPRITLLAKVASIAIFIGYAAIAVGLFMRVGIDPDYVKNKEREAQNPGVTATAGKEGK